MNTFLKLTCLLMLASGAFAQAPKLFNFQGVARNLNGQLVTNKTVSVRLSILKTSIYGETAYQETHKPLTSASGSFTLVAGSGSPDFGVFADLDWTKGPYFLRVELDVAGGTAYLNLGTTQMLSVPYAIYSDQTGQAAHALNSDEASHAAKSDSTKEAKHAIEADKFTDNKLIVLKGKYQEGEDLGNVANLPALIWYPKKAAFRAGFSDNGSWNDANIGVGSVAFGDMTKASGNFSSAFGLSAEASGDQSVALGQLTKATASNSFAMGKEAKAIGTNSFAIGNTAIASGNTALAMGNLAFSSGLSAVSIGTSTDASGDYSVAIGHELDIKTKDSFVIGKFNNDQDNPNDPEPLRRLFQLGNGTAFNQRSNALTVLQNGFVGIGKNALFPQYILDIDGRPRLRHNGQTAGLFFNTSQQIPNGFIGMKDDQSLGTYIGNAWQFYVFESGDAFLTGKLYDGSDRRLKRDIVQVSNSLANLSKLKGYDYFWIDKSRSQSLQTGMIAQEVEDVFPHLVHTGKDGLKSVDYLGLIPHLIEAVKELKTDIRKLETTNEQLTKENRELNERMNTDHQAKPVPIEMSDVYKRLIELEAKLNANAAVSDSTDRDGK